MPSALPTAEPVPPASPLLEPAPGGSRRPEIEWLRVLAMLAVFTAHVALVFTPWQGWHIQNDERSIALSQIALLVWPWVMPLFMVLAGGGARHSLARRSDEDYGYERTVRLLVPFVFGTLLVVPPQIWLERLAQGRFDGSLLEFYPRFFECCYPEGNFAAGHLWFVAYLWVYAIASVPLLRRLEGPWHGVLDTVVRWTDGPGGILRLALPLIATQLALRGPFPQTLAFIDDWSTHVTLFGAFLLGFALAASPPLADRLDAQWRNAVAPALLGSAGLAWLAWRADTTAVLPTAWGLRYFVFWTLASVATFCWTIMLMGFARAHLRRGSRALTWASRQLYPFYLFHQTVIVAVAYFVVQGPWAIAAKAAAVFALSLTATLGLCVLGGRSRPARWLLGIAKPAALTRAGAPPRPA